MALSKRRPRACRGGEARRRTTANIEVRLAKLGLLMACGRHNRNGMNVLIGEARRMALPKALSEVEGSKGQRPASKGTPVVYFLRLRSGTIYVGSSTDFGQRLADHSSGWAGRTTALDPPVEVLRVEILPTFTDARHREAQLKRWSRAKKEALIRGDPEALHSLSRSRD